MEEKKNQLTTKEFQKQAQANYEEISQCKKAIGSGILLLGKALKDNQEKLYYKEMGHKTFESFIASPELSINRAFAYRVISVYKGFVEKLGVGSSKIENIDVDKLALILPVCNKANVGKWIAEAEVSSRSDLREKVQGKKQQNQIARGDDWIEYSNVWLKTQPIPRWGKKPKSSIYGQFVANLLTYYSQKADTVVSYGIGDSVVEDVCIDLKRIYIDGDNEKLSEVKNTADLVIVDVDGCKQDSIDSIRDVGIMSLKKDGKLAVYLKGDYSELDFYIFLTSMIGGVKGGLAPIELIILNEKPTIDQANQAIKSRTMARTSERIMIFKKIKKP